MRTLLSSFRFQNFENNSDLFTILLEMYECLVFPFILRGGMLDAAALYRCDRPVLSGRSPRPFHSLFSALSDGTAAVPDRLSSIKFGFLPDSPEQSQRTGRRSSSNRNGPACNRRHFLFFYGLWMGGGLSLRFFALPTRQGKGFGPRSAVSAPEQSSFSESTEDRERCLLPSTSNCLDIFIIGAL